MQSSTPVRLKSTITLASVESPHRPPRYVLYSMRCSGQCNAWSVAPRTFLQLALDVGKSGSDTKMLLLRKTQPPAATDSERQWSQVQSRMMNDGSTAVSRHDSSLTAGMTAIREVCAAVAEDFSLGPAPAIIGLLRSLSFCFRRRINRQPSAVDPLQTSTRPS